MNRNDRFEGSEGNGIVGGLPGAWKETGRHPYLPDGELATCRTDQGVMIYDPDHPELYLTGSAVEVGEER